MIYLHILHVEMNILLLLPVSIKILNIIDALCFKYIENNIESVVVFPLPDNSWQVDSSIESFKFKFP